MSKICGIYVVKNKITGAYSYPILCGNHLELWKVLADSIRSLPPDSQFRDHVCYHIADYDFVNASFTSLSSPEYVINLDEINDTIKRILENKEGTGETSPTSVEAVRSREESEDLSSADHVG